MNWWSSERDRALEKRRKKNGWGGRDNDDALYNRDSGCKECGGTVYYDGLCVSCFEDAGGDGPGRDSMG